MPNWPRSYLDFNLVKSFPVINSNNASNHLRDYSHVPALLTRRSITLLQNSIITKRKI